MQSFNTKQTAHQHRVDCRLPVSDFQFGKTAKFYRMDGEYYATEVLRENWVRKLSVLADSFDRTAGHRFFTHRELFSVLRLLVDERIVVLVAAREVFRRGVAANVAVDTRRVHVKRAADVLFNFVVPIRQCQVNFKLKNLCATASRVRHLFRFHQPIKFFTRQKTKLDSGVAQTNFLFVSVLCYLGGLVVTNMRVQRSNQHQR